MSQSKSAANEMYSTFMGLSNDPSYLPFFNVHFEIDEHQMPNELRFAISKHMNPMVTLSVIEMMIDSLQKIRADTKEVINGNALEVFKRIGISPEMSEIINNLPQGMMDPKQIMEYLRKRSQPETAPEPPAQKSETEVVLDALKNYFTDF